jgi:arsenate reductase
MNRSRLIIYHNPNCSKSRETLQILEDNHLSPDIIEYLEKPPTAQELKDVIKMLGVSARDLLRTTEPVYREADLDDTTLTDDEIIDAICEYPALLQRPIVISGTRAVIGRPPARVLEIVA